MPIFTPARRWQPPYYGFKREKPGRRMLAATERAIKGALFGCRMCGNCMLQGHEATRCKAATSVTSGRPKPGGTGGRSPPAAEGRVPTASEPDDGRQALSLG